ncbi:stage II sporulation protein E [uncultured Clostridium sp.]|uniref:stage II sporulation protein E n=1 Tax=uncultured Clostridium sp. TaxID=59620 RepID=UPI0025D9C320|nr:stage II sporulation protein E [uncultured Clostridium sp.]
MQYGLNVNKYEEVKNVQKTNRKIDVKLPVVNLALIFLVGILLGRVSLLLNQSDSKGIAPFGIAYLMAIAIRNNKQKDISAGAGVLLGCYTVMTSLSDGNMYLISISMLTLCYLIIPINKRVKREILGFALILSTFFIYGASINKYEFGVNATLCLVETVLIMPIYYVIKYAVDSIEEFDYKYLFSTEQLVSISILFCLMVSGIGNVEFMNYSLKNICALFLVLSVAYLGGAAYGAMIGVAMGIILGVASSDMMWSIGFFSVGGLIVGIFKDTGKIFSILAGIIIYFALGLYSNMLSLKFGVEVLSGCVLFLCIPRSAFKSIEVEINPDRKREFIDEGKLNCIREEFTFKLRELTNVLNTVSNCLGAVTENENLLIKGKGSALVENLADRCCANCENRIACWEREFQQTYNSFQSLIQSYEENAICMPKDLEKRCVQSFTLLRNVEKIVDNNTVNEAIKERLAEGRKLLAYHIDSVSNTLDNLLNDFKKQVIVNTDLEKRVRIALNKKSVDYNDIFCYTDINGKIKIKISMDNYKGDDYLEKRVMPLLNNITRKKLCVCEEESNLNHENEECVVSIQEESKFYMVSYNAMAPKSGERYIGDSYTFGNTRDGCYMTILSDGMGFGPEAGKESKATVDLVERFIESGFDENITINTVNSIMGMRFAEDERYATLDLNKVDLYNGDAVFVKIGAAPTFIKRGNEVKTISSKNLPFGLVDEVDVEIIKEKLQPGDIIVSVSDGVLDIDKSKIEEKTWLEGYLSNINADPRELSEKILDKAKEMSGGTVEDDMTVVVSKMYLAN